MKSPKKIIPRTMGLTIVPSNKPNRIQSLLRGRSMSGLIRVVITKSKPRAKNTYEVVVLSVIKKRAPKITKTALKNKPNFLLEGSSIAAKFIVLPYLQLRPVSVFQP